MKQTAGGEIAAAAEIFAVAERLAGDGFDEHALGAAFTAIGEQAPALRLNFDGQVARGRNSFHVALFSSNGKVESEVYRAAGRESICNLRRNGLIASKSSDDKNTQKSQIHNAKAQRRKDRKEENAVEQGNRWQHASPLRDGRRTCVAGARADEDAAGVLLDGVTDPADGATEREEHERRAVGQVGDPRQRRQPEIDVRLMPDQPGDLLGGGQDEARLRRVGVRLGD